MTVANSLPLGVDAVRAALLPFLRWELTSWLGLPQLSCDALEAALGPGSGPEDLKLGWYPAQRFTYPAAEPAGGIHAYSRNGRVVLIEGLAPPPLSVLRDLGEPSAIKPHEIVIPNAYVREYLYCPRGLVLSVAESLETALPLQIVRFRGIQPLEAPEKYGPEFYMRFEDRFAW